MKTIKLKLEKLKESELKNYVLKFNDIVRFSFNRFQEGLKEIEVRSKCRILFKDQNSWFVQNGIKIGLGLFNKHKDSKIIFGGKNNLKRYLKKLISKDEFKQNRLMPISIQGEKLHRGNRLFNFDLENNTICFKPNNKTKIELKFIELHKNYKKELILLQELIDKKKVTVSVSIKDNYIYLVYDESLIKQEEFKDLKQNRILGIDLNPNYIGVSILEFDKNDEFEVLFKEVFDLSKIKNKNKKRFELYQINHKIIEICNYWKVGSISIEELNIKSSDKGNGKRFNKLCNNDWCRNSTVSNLRILCSIYRIKLVEVNSAYSSQIGNIIYGNSFTPDMIASSIEVARRGYKKFSKGWFYPRFTKSLNLLNEQWKQTLRDNFIKDWKELFTLIKNSKLKYRVSLDECKNNSKVFRFNHIKSYTNVYCFI